MIYLVRHGDTVFPLRAESFIDAIRKARAMFFQHNKNKKISAMRLEMAV